MHILFLCTENSCRSILAEAIARKLGGDRLQVASAGTHPAASIHPLAVKHLQQRGYDTGGLYSKSLDCLTDTKPRAIVTLCDTAAEQQCPTALADGVQAHWPTPDPTKLKGSAVITNDAFDATFEMLNHAISKLLDHDLESMEDNQLKVLLDSIATR
ncbi:MAG: arsenate reductase ArsC [Arenicella sp.]|nr:arsenate reductase ArsC [Arenicella sp.]